MLKYPVEIIIIQSIPEIENKAKVENINLVILSCPSVTLFQCPTLSEWNMVRIFFCSKDMYMGMYFPENMTIRLFNILEVSSDLKYASNVRPLPY